MKVAMIKSIWGLTEGATMRDKLALIAGAGYEGVECGPPAESPAEWADLLAEFGLIHVCMLFPFTGAEAVEQLQSAAKYRPHLVVMHDGRDFYTREEGRAFYRECLAAEADLGLTVGHETHRGRLLYSPWTTREYLEEFPALKLTADFSHWCVVTESLLDNPRLAGDLDLAIERTVHIHGRVGYAEGPQVPDPSAPEYRDALLRHESLWDRIVARHAAAGTKLLTFDPEFGPPAYMHTLPHTNQPVANLWDVCLWMAERQKERWAAHR
jgi:sugar phosphate isomerase/epimerase